MIRFGPAGIPLSCKGRTLRDGIADVHHLGLAALEAQFIKVNPLQRVSLDEEIGQHPRDLLQQLLVAVGPTSLDTAEPTLSSLLAPVKRRATLTTLTTSLAKDYTDLQTTRALARSLDVDLTLHAPYYVDFFGSAEARQRSIRQIQWAGVLAEGLGGRLVVSHLGFYGAASREESIDQMTKIVGDLSRWLQTFTHGTARLGVEPSGHPDVFGSRAEVLELARRVRGVLPILNIPHVAARERMPLEKPEDFQPLVDEFRAASGGSLYLNFSGVEYFGPGEMRLTPVKRGQIRFDPLAEVLIERDYDATVISSSPLLEHDAMYMKLLYERALTRRWVKRHAPPPPPPKPAATKLVGGRGKPGKASPSPARPKPSPRTHSKPRGARPPSHRRDRRRPPAKRKASPRPARPRRKPGRHGRRR